MLKLLRVAALLGVLAVGPPAQAIGLEAHLGLAVTFWNFNSGTMNATDARNGARGSHSSAAMPRHNGVSAMALHPNPQARIRPSVSGRTSTAQQRDARTKGAEEHREHDVAGEPYPRQRSERRRQCVEE